jgi:acyl-CoA thioester hydrolase
MHQFQEKQVRRDYMMKERNTFKLTVPVRFRDLDAIGHVNNATYFTYMEEARKEFFRQVFDCRKASDFPFILAEISCRFLKAVQMEELEVGQDIWVSHVGRKSFTFKYRLYRRDDPAWIFAEGQSVQVYYDYDTGRPVEIPASFKAEIEQRGLLWEQ